MGKKTADIPVVRPQVGVALERTGPGDRIARLICADERSGKARDHASGKGGVPRIRQFVHEVVDGASPPRTRIERPEGIEVQSLKLELRED